MAIAKRRTSILSICFGSLTVIASEPRQSNALVGPSGLLRRYVPRNDGGVSG
jgi:hypothetical protein